MRSDLSSNTLKLQLNCITVSPDQGLTRIRFVDGRDDISEEEAFRWGPSVGAGLRVPGFLIEAVYHVIQWEPEAGAGLFKTNSLEGRVGLLLPLG